MSMQEHLTVWWMFLLLRFSSPARSAAGTFMKPKIRSLKELVKIWSEQRIEF